MHEIPAWFEITALTLLAGILLADLLIIGRRPHVPSFRESAIWVSVYIGLALLFGVAVLVVSGGTAAGEFYAGWLTEYSLSLDNLFVFTVIMAAFAVPRELQQRTLMIGIVIALVLRAVFILLGAAVIERYTWVFYLFGVILLVTALKMARGQDDDEEYKENALIRGLRKVLPISDHYDSTRLSTRVDARWMLTPMLIVLLALGTTDLLFAFDSIPAIFGLTQDPFIVFATNLFALMGLRQLYFLLGGLLERLVYLTYGLAIILGFIGVKLVLHALHTNSVPFVNHGAPVEWAPEIPIWLSLVVIVGTLGVTTVASLAKTARSNRIEPA
ncbi:Integral membrane protein TerC [Beutenbergia cavernae DSM 12333]|uniref:Integral membrane protein TerC n=1 Tax=Beutenbergia cavernae (strain ATCC BAA-8 / DSM 12333 / CCUG 43141 / JCM 11478 / NBRC 16432 / NCIMB 13614 / HKI 0122) TaxID=471853 RepID=C5BV47_BEUC1|nr:TerC family protein [Beutenbergia cavernae]ACQ80434.1 Integral membrane protein TerC [Beutenbergia cavernae DSM 12333]